MRASGSSTAIASNAAEAAARIATKGQNCSSASPCSFVGSQVVGRLGIRPCQPATGTAGPPAAPIAMVIVAIVGHPLIAIEAGTASAAEDTLGIIVGLDLEAAEESQTSAGAALPPASNTATTATNDCPAFNTD